MKRLFVLVLVGLSLLLLVSLTSAAGGERGFKFEGLYVGNDPNDGSLRHISVTDLDGDGVYELTQTDSFWSLCGGASGIAVGTGTVGDDGILHWTGSLTCSPPGPPTVPFFAVDYAPDKSSDVLVEIPLPPVPLGPDILHRVSTGQSGE